ncbi:DNA double-strand break repair nuclease NurA [Chloroflexota bacterium]
MVRVTANIGPGIITPEKEMTTMLKIMGSMSLLKSRLLVNIHPHYNIFISPAPVLELGFILNYTLGKTMSLDLSKVAAQVGGMITRLIDGAAERQQRLRTALDTLSNPAIDLETLQKKIAGARTTWLVAELTESLDRHYPTPPLPPDFSVIATDGSHIDVDRHRAARYYLINTGSAVLHYGSAPFAELISEPHLYASDEELVITPPGSRGRELPIEGNLLGAKRSIEECRQLVKLAMEVPPDFPTLALQDGTLILWGLEAYPDFVTDVLLHKGFLPCLDDMHKLNETRPFAPASYISFPRSTDVVNVLRLVICPQQPVDCDRCETRDCEVVAGVRDRDLFADLLAEGERSALFISPSKVSRDHYGMNRIYFYYLNVGEEIARIEIPQWAAENESLFNMSHSLVLDQCRRGQGYPVALSEAHEQAVVTGADREYFWQLLDETLVAEKILTHTSAKSFSKKTRWV